MGTTSSIITGKLLFLSQAWGKRLTPDGSPPGRVGPLRISFSAATQFHMITSSARILFGVKPISEMLTVVHVFDVREGKDSGTVEAVIVPARSVLIRLPLLLQVLVVRFPATWNFTEKDV